MYNSIHSKNRTEVLLFTTLKSYGEEGSNISSDDLAREVLQPYKFIMLNHQLLFLLQMLLKLGHCPDLRQASCGEVIEILFN